MLSTAEMLSMYRMQTDTILSNKCAPYTHMVPLCKSIMDKSTHIMVYGASGRMGSRICALACIDPSMRLIAPIVREQSSRIGQPMRECGDGSLRFVSPGNAVQIARSRGEVVIDFSSDEGARHALALALARRAALLVGTTALSAETIATLRAASEKISVCITPNTSIGVSALASLVASAARLLGPAFECSIVEAHHSKKKDAPSGTALRLARAARDAGSVISDDQILAIRAGDVIGEHTIRFSGAGEYLEFTHRATSRDLFAAGALHAARWLSDRTPGFYAMEDVLDLASRSPQNRH